MQDIVSGAIDADLLDYLRRDSYFTGLSHNYDDRIFRTFAVSDGRLVIRLARHGMDRPDARSEIFRVLRLRYFLTERVYYHHTKVVAGAMISKAVELAVNQGELHEGDLLRQNDWTLLELLRSCRATGAARLAERIQQRDLLKRGYVISPRSIGASERPEWVRRFHDSASERAAAERDLALALNLPFEEVILYCPAMTVMKEAAVPVENVQGTAQLTDPGDESHTEIQALQQRYAELWRLYVFVPAKKIKEAAVASRELLGPWSEHFDPIDKHDARSVLT